MPGTTISLVNVSVNKTGETPTLVIHRFPIKGDIKGLDTEMNERWVDDTYIGKDGQWIKLIKGK